MKTKIIWALITATTLTIFTTETARCIVVEISDLIKITTDPMNGEPPEAFNARVPFDIRIRLIEKVLEEGRDRGSEDLSFLQILAVASDLVRKTTELVTNFFTGVGVTWQELSHVAPQIKLIYNFNELAAKWTRLDTDNITTYFEKITAVRTLALWENFPRGFNGSNFRVGLILLQQEELTFAIYLRPPPPWVIRFPIDKLIMDTISDFIAQEGINRIDIIITYIPINPGTAVEKIFKVYYVREDTPW